MVRGISSGLDGAVNRLETGNEPNDGLWLRWFRLEGWYPFRFNFPMERRRLNTFVGREEAFESERDIKRVGKNRGGRRFLLTPDPTLGFDGFQFGPDLSH